MRELFRAAWELFLRVFAFLLVLFFCLPGAAVAVAAVLSGYGLKTPLVIEIEIILLVATALAFGVSARAVLGRLPAWAVAMTGFAALANALAPGRPADQQLAWLGVGALLGAILGMVTRWSRHDPVANTVEGETRPTEREPTRSEWQLGPRGRIAAIVTLAVVGVLVVRDGQRVAKQSRISETVATSRGCTIYDVPSTPTLLFKWFDAIPHGQAWDCLSGVTLGDGAGNDELALLSRIGLHAVPELRELRLFGSTVNDDGLVFVAPIRQLERLTLGCATTDAGLVHLDDLLNLRHLELSRTQVTGQGLRQMRQHPNLLYLGLAHTHLADEDLPAINDLSNLVCLDLTGTPVTDSGLVHLGKLPNLKTLLLMRTKVSDAGLKHLTALPTLRFLFLSSTGVTMAGIRDYAKVRPEVVIVP